MAIELLSELFEKIVELAGEKALVDRDLSAARSELYDLKSQKKREAEEGANLAVRLQKDNDTLKTRLANAEKALAEIIAESKTPVSSPEGSLDPESAAHRMLAIAESYYAETY